jgi:hypothetical protein
MTLDDHDTQELLRLLRRVEVGKVSTPIFHELARLMVLPAVEVIPLFDNGDGETQVLLTRRVADDPIWPNQWHTPGRILRPTDVDGSGTYRTAIQRLVQTELRGVEVGAAVFVETEFRTVARSAESAALHWVELQNDHVPIGQLFRVSDLPDDIIDHHRPMIEKVHSHFLGSKRRAD